MIEYIIAYTFVLIMGISLTKVGISLGMETKATWRQATQTFLILLILRRLVLYAFGL